MNCALFWTEGGAVWNKGAIGVLAATREVEERLPFALLGFDSDNGGEFLNHHLHSYMVNRTEAVAFTRSRPYHSDDNAHVEQKNWTWARQLLGYGRLEDPELVLPISVLYREVWAPWQNFFLPCLKLAQKWRQGSQWHKRYELPRTAYCSVPRYSRELSSDRFVWNRGAVASCEVRTSSNWAAEILPNDIVRMFSQ